MSKQDETNVRLQNVGTYVSYVYTNKMWPTAQPDFTLILPISLVKYVIY